MNRNEGFTLRLLDRDYRKSERKKEESKEKRRSRSRGEALRRQRIQRTTLHIPFHTQLSSVEQPIRPHLDPFLSTSDSQMLQQVAHWDVRAIQQRLHPETSVLSIWELGAVMTASQEQPCWLAKAATYWMMIILSAHRDSECFQM